MFALVLFALAVDASIPPESPAEAKVRHERVAERRKGTDIICHRGSSEHAHENIFRDPPVPAAA